MLRSKLLSQTYEFDYRVGDDLDRTIALRIAKQRLIIYGTVVRKQCVVNRNGSNAM